MPHTIVNLKHEPHALANGAVRIDRRTKWGQTAFVHRQGRLRARRSSSATADGSGSASVQAR